MRERKLMIQLSYILCCYGRNVFDLMVQSIAMICDRAIWWCSQLLWFVTGIWWCSQLLWFVREEFDSAVNCYKLWEWNLMVQSIAMSCDRNLMVQSIAVIYDRNLMVQSIAISWERNLMVQSINMSCDRNLMVQLIAMICDRNLMVQSIAVICERGIWWCSQLLWLVTEEFDGAVNCYDLWEEFDGAVNCYDLWERNLMVQSIARFVRGIWWCSQLLWFVRGIW